MIDSILCANKEDAKKVIDQFGMQHIEDWEYLDNGKILLKFNCSVAELPEREKKQ